MSAKFSVVRFYQNEFDPVVVLRGLTEEEAKERCKDPEGSSRTCTSKEGVARTEAMGPWFEGYREE